MNDLISNLEIQFNERYFNLDKDFIIELNNKADEAGINNVVTGLCEDFSTIGIISEEKELIYEILFGSNLDGLWGKSLKLDTKLTPNERDCLVLMFSQQISLKTRTNMIDLFNTFQFARRSMYENYKYLTVNPETFSKYNDPNPLIIAKNLRGVIPVRIIEKTEYYKMIFDNVNLDSIDKSTKHVYLMYNERNNYIKIGQSKNPKLREKTLQGEEPNLQLLAIWEAPVKVEKELHRLYKDKNIRGEWFDLSFDDLQEIKEYMELRKLKPLTNKL